MLNVMVFCFLLIPCLVKAEIIVGVSTHIGQSKQRADFVHDSLGELGLNSFRDEYSWNKVERIKGVLKAPASLMEMDRAIDLSRDKLIEPLLVLDYGNSNYDGGDFPVSVSARQGFLRYVSFVVSRFKGKVRYYEVWNEWNIGIGLPARLKRKGAANEYCLLLQDTYSLIKSIDRDAVVIGGSVANKDNGWIRQLLEAGCLKYMDGFSVHPYNFSEGSKATANEVVKYIDQLNELLSLYNKGADFPVYITEIGWPSHIGPYGRSQKAAAEELVAFISEIDKRAYVRGVWIYDLVDDGSNPFDKEHNFGLFNSQLVRKKQFEEIKKLQKK